MRLCSLGGGCAIIKAPPFILPLRIPASKEGPSSPSILFAHTPLPGSVTEHIRAARARGMGVGGGQAAAIVLRVLSPPPSPSSPTLTGLPEPAAPSDKGASIPHQAQPPPPAAVLSSVQSPQPQPTLPPIQPHPWQEGASEHLWRSWTGCSIPGPALQQQPEGGFGGRARSGSEGSGVYLLVRRNILPPGKEGIEKLESAVQRESDMTRRRRHGGRCGSGGGAGSKRAGRRLEPQRAG